MAGFRRQLAVVASGAIVRLGPGRPMQSRFGDSQGSVAEIFATRSIEIIVPFQASYNHATENVDNMVIHACMHACIHTCIQYLTQKKKVQL